MPRAAAKDAKPSPLEGIRWGRFTFWLITGAIGMVFVLWAWHRIEVFLIQDDRFRLAVADDFTGQRSIQQQPGNALRDGMAGTPESPWCVDQASLGCQPSLSIQGVQYASPSQIRHVFAEDFGRSLYLVPIQVRRSRLLAIDWVEEATVSKIWPNSVRVSIVERKPVAFVRLPATRGISQFALIDRDGYILRPRTASRFTLPVISGVRESQPIIERRLRVRRVLAMLQSIGPMANQVSEVDAGDPDDLIIADHIGGAVVNLMMGDENYAERLKNFLANYDEIKARRPDAKLLDLRVDGVITAAGGNALGG